MITDEQLRKAILDNIGANWAAPEFFVVSKAVPVVRELLAKVWDEALEDGSDWAYDRELTGRDVPKPVNPYRKGIS